jgi:ABC-type phosphate transport system permease subunit
MDSRTIGTLIGGFAVKAAAAAFAIYVAYSVAVYVHDVFTKVQTALPM